MSERPVSERIEILLNEFTNGNKAAMGRALGISGQAIADLVDGRKGGPSFLVLQRMLTIYPEVRPEWLILGEGPKLRSEEDLEKLEANPKADRPPKDSLKGFIQVRSSQSEREFLLAISNIASVASAFTGTGSVIMLQRPVEMHGDCVKTNLPLAQVKAMIEQAQLG